MANIVDLADDAEDQPGIVERLAPMREVVLGEQPVENRDQFARVLIAARVGGEPLGVEFRRVEAGLEFVPAPLVGGDL